MLQLVEWETLPLTPPQPLRVAARQITQADREASFNGAMGKSPTGNYPPKN
jgi:hypothetical protein